MKNPTRRESLRLIGSGAAALAFPNFAFGNSKPVSGKRIMRAIPSTKEMLPAVGMGTWKTFDIGADDSNRLSSMKEVFNTFAELGGKLIDSSPMYGRSEKVAGDFISEAKIREKLFIATKVWTRGKAEGIQQMEESMKKLNAPVIDLMQVHNLVDVKTQLDTLKSWKKEGRIRYLGVTHYHAGSHDAVAEIISSEPLDFIQINYSVAEREAENRLLPLAKDKGVAVIVNRPFWAGGVFPRVNGKPVPDWAKEIECETWAQILLKFVISHPAVTTAIPATSKVKHLRENLAACYGPLPDEALRKRIAAAAA